jgi:Tyrosine phosphatase family
LAVSVYVSVHVYVYVAIITWMTRLAPLFLAALLGCAGTYPTPPPLPTHDSYRLARFDRVADGVYRSSQPTAAQFRELTRRYGIRSVIKLNHGYEPVPPGVFLIYRPLDPFYEPSPAELRALLDEIDGAPKPLLIHCTHGEDRTGLIVALYRMRHGASVDAAYTDMIRHRFHPYSGLWRAWLRAASWTEKR